MLNRNPHNLLVFAIALLCVAQACLLAGDAELPRVADNVLRKMTQDAKLVQQKYDNQLATITAIRDRDMKIVRDKAIRDFKILLDNATKNGQLDQAMAIRDTIAKLEAGESVDPGDPKGPEFFGVQGDGGPEPPDQPIARVRDSLEGTQWNDPAARNSVLEFAADGVGFQHIDGKKHPFRWGKIDDNHYTLLWGSGFTFVMAVGPDRRSMDLYQGININQGTPTRTVTLK